MLPVILSATQSANLVSSASQPVWNRFLLSTVGILGWFLIQAVARTWRWEIHGVEHFKKLEAQKLPLIYAFWHGRILASIYFWRNRGIVVLTSENKDGEYISHVIHHFGYGSSRGSTSKGAVKGTIGLIRTLKQGAHVAFTVDGPRGPRYQVQQGVAWLASYSQHPILPFHIEGKRAKKFSSWDQFQVPLPFTRVRVDIAEPMFLEKDLPEDVLEQKRIELETTLNELREKAELWSSS